MFPSRYLNAADVGDSTRTVTISRIEREKLDDGEKFVLYFLESSKGLILNKTNARALFDTWPDSATWFNNPVELVCLPTTKPDGSPTRGIRVRPVTQPASNNDQAAVDQAFK